MKGKKVELDLFHMNDLPEDILRSLTDDPDHICRTGSELYMQSGQYVIRINDDQQGNEFLYCFARDHRFISEEGSGNAELYRQIMTDNIPGSILNNVSRQENYSNLNKYVVVFRTFLPMKEGLFSVFVRTVPVEKDDIIIPVQYDSVALVRDLSSLTKDEVVEYASAVIDTLEEEGIGCIKAGIGRDCIGITSMRNAYLEAQKAIDIGSRYHGSEKVYQFSNLFFETMIDSIPAEKRSEIKKSFLEMCSGGELTDELLETVRVFFRNDLNLSATSKQLYIHRNTLNYRLDKIQKMFHLDVRSFHDAIVFKMITDIPEKE